MNFYRKDIVSIDQFDANSIKKLIKNSQQIAKKINANKIAFQTLKGRVIALLFFEPSSRTYNSFSSSVQRLGGSVIGIQDPMVTSMKKGETFEDTVRIMAGYSDAIIIRHPQMGYAKKAADLTELPVINAGDGIGEHPTQALLDMFTIYKKFNRLERLKGLIAGDLINGRTLHSLMKALSYFKKNTIYLLSPEKLRVKIELLQECQSKGLIVKEIRSEKEIPRDCNFWYWTRIQQERFSSENEYNKYKNSLILSEKILSARGNRDMIILHPLPRINEIPPEIDRDPRAHYFQQARNGLYVRMALLDLVFKKI